MGTIVYHNGVLVGDSRFYDKVGDINIPYEKPRIILDRSKRFAYGICGSNIPFSDPSFEDTIAQFILAYSHNPLYNTEFPYKEIHVLVMTRSKTFTIYNDGNLVEGKYYRQFIPHEPHAIIAYGTGSSNAIMSIIGGNDAVDALRDVTVNDFYTGGDLYGVKREMLIEEEISDIVASEGKGWFKGKLSRISMKGSQ